jgi:hypothetical protein
MTAEHHFERRELNVRARALLADDGTLSGPELRVAELSFRSGDEVIARITDRSLRTEGAARDAYVRNGSLGTVVDVHEHGVVVDFERWGRVAVPLSYLERKVSAGIVGGLQHAYALTSHAAQGKTFAVAAPLVTDASSPEGVYVGITRGQFDLQAVAIRRQDLSQPLTDDALPVLRDETSALLATERRLRANGPELLASELAVVRERRGEAAAQRGQDKESMEEGRITIGFSEDDSLVDSVQEPQSRGPDSGEVWETVETDRAIATPSGPVMRW